MLGKDVIKVHEREVLREYWDGSVHVDLSYLLSTLHFLEERDTDIIHERESLLYLLNNLSC
jgi:hypothetical protein